MYAVDRVIAQVTLNYYVSICNNATLLSRTRSIDRLPTPMYDAIWLGLRCRSSDKQINYT